VGWFIDGEALPQGFLIWGRQRAACGFAGRKTANPIREETVPTKSPRRR